MSQLPLFEAQALQLVADAEGGIVYTPAFVDAATAARWYAALRDGVDWSQERRLMYERDVAVPRLVARYADDAGRLPEALREIRERVRAHLDAPFNSLGLNWYRDGRDSVAPHNDRLNELVPGQPIALLSLGATRRMSIRTKAAPRHTLQLDLTAGSLLLMSHASQHLYEHGIPKSRTAVGGRISVALRVRPPAPGSG